MQSIKMKIHGYDEASKTMTVSFASDDNLQGPEAYTPLAYQTHFFQETDPNEILKKIAKSGLSIAQTQRLQETRDENPAADAVFQSLVGQTLEYTLDDLSGAPDNEVEV